MAAGQQLGPESPVGRAVGAMFNVTKLPASDQAWQAAREHALDQVRLVTAGVPTALGITAVLAAGAYGGLAADAGGPALRARCAAEVAAEDEDAGLSFGLFEDRRALRGGEDYRRGFAHGAAAAAAHDLLSLLQVRTLDRLLRRRAGAVGRAALLVYDAAVGLGKAVCADAAAGALCDALSDALPRSPLPRGWGAVGAALGSVAYAAVRICWRARAPAPTGTETAAPPSAVYYVDKCVVCFEDMDTPQSALVCCPCGHGCCCRRESCRRQTEPAMMSAGCFMCREPVRRLYLP
eukprot:TRINITY_DN51162_c0_g1_i1.p2 TRINITY_DN51162_c0_g1~~TRINITY_DN51162_c0_g1_i1.p2  ORF type:complete len:315 (+),score=101.47 TRINITY_DN51162_c0_g1_i1:68-946(+)